MTYIIGSLSLSLSFEACAIYKLFSNEKMGNLSLIV